MNNDPINQSLEDIEDAGVKILCPNCHTPQIKLVCQTSTCRQTTNYIGACMNKNCFRYCDLSKMPSWVPVKENKW